jgi:hypothetical protein
MTIRAYFIGFMVGGLALLGTSCGDNVDCGDGTVRVDGVCVPSADACGAGATYNPDTGRCDPDISGCAAGTVLESGECVPDGSVICETGTTYNPDTGKCDPDITGCGAGTVFTDGQCVLQDDTLIGDVVEADEDNGWDGTPGSFTTPEPGDSLTLSGCITPVDRDNDGVVDIDEDLFTFSVPGQTLLNITVDGIDGLAGGFAIYPTDEALMDNEWMRLGVNLVGDTATRQVFLPKAGTYTLVISDSRSLLYRGVAGDSDTCYYATITNTDLPTPTPYAPTLSCSNGDSCTGDDGCTSIDDGLCLARHAGTVGDDVAFVSVAVADGDIFSTSLYAESAAMSTSFVLSNGTTYLGNAGLGGATGFASLPVGFPSTISMDGLADGTLVIAVDHYVNVGIEEVSYGLIVETTGATAAAADGTTATVATIAGQSDYLFWFDVVAGEVVHLGVDSPDALGVGVFGPGMTPHDNGSTDYDNWFYFLTAGRYYIQLVYSGAGASFDVDITRTHIVPQPLAIGTSTGNRALDTDSGLDWYLLDVAPIDWLSTTLSALAGTWGDVDIDLYSGTNQGRVGSTALPAVDYLGLTGTNDEVQRITFDDSSLFLVRVSDGDDAIDGDEHYELLISDLQPTVLGSAPTSSDDVALAADAVHYYIARADARIVDVLTMTATDDTGASELMLSAVAQGTGEVGASYISDEDLFANLWISPTARGYLAFRIDETAGAAGTYDLNVVIDSGHPNYDVVAGTMPFTNICPGAGGNGIVHSLVDDDEGLSQTPISLPFAFDLFGVAVTDMTVSSNGFLAAVGNYAGLTGWFEWTNGFPNVYLDAPLIAPFWGDHGEMVVCVLSEATQLTVQWTGVDFWESDEPVQYQTIIADDGRIHFLYGPLHHDDHSPATIGAQVAGAAYGVMVDRGYGIAAPDTSYTLLPIADPTP